MLKDYKNIQHDVQSTFSWRHFESICFFLVGLTCGLCIAAVFYFYKHDFGDPAPVIIKIESPVTAEETLSESPTFDFYQILPNVTVHTSEWEADDIEEQQPDLSAQNTLKENNKNPEKASPSTEESVKAHVYVLQIGAFKDYTAAVLVQDKIALMELVADIQRVVIHGKDVRYRVRMGPYKEAEKLSRVRQQLEQQNLSYIVLRLQ